MWWMYKFRTPLHGKDMGKHKPTIEGEVLSVIIKDKKMMI